MTITGLDQAVRIMELTDRICELEAALDWALDHTKGPETEPTELSEILNASRSRLLGAALETSAESQNIPCSCGVGDCNKRILAHNEYCTEDHVRYHNRRLTRLHHQPTCRVWLGGSECNCSDEKTGADSK